MKPTLVYTTACVFSVFATVNSAPTGNSKTGDDSCENVNAFQRALVGDKAEYSNMLTVCETMCKYCYEQGALDGVTGEDFIWLGFDQQPPASMKTCRESCFLSREEPVSKILGYRFMDNCYKTYASEHKC